MKARQGSRTSQSYRHLFWWNHGRLLLSASSSRNCKIVGSNRRNCTPEPPFAGPVGAHRTLDLITDRRGQETRAPALAPAPAHFLPRPVNKPSAREHPKRETFAKHRG